MEASVVLFRMININNADNKVSMGRVGYPMTRPEMLFNLNNQNLLPLIWQSIQQVFSIVLISR